MERIKAYTGSELHCKTWGAEAALRMLMNNLDPDVAERPEDLVVYGGGGKAARNWDAYNNIVKALTNLEPDETLLVQSGKPVAVLPSHEDAPRVIIANSNIVPNWATWENFWEYERLGLIMYGQMTAGSWIYIGTQGILQGTYETFCEAARKHFSSTLKGKLVLTAGLGGMGGAQPLAVTMNEGVVIAAEVDPERIEKRLKTGYVDMMVDSVEQALSLADDAMRQSLPLSIGLLGNAADVYEEFVRRGITPSLVTDQTSAHDVLNGYVPSGMPLAQAKELRVSDPEKYKKLALETIARHVKAMLELQKRGSRVFDYGNNIRAQAKKQGVENAFDFEGFVPAYIRPLFCEGQGPFRWAALSGDPEDIYATDEALIKLFPEKERMIRWLKMAREKVSFQGLPSRICWLGYGERDKAGIMFNELVASGKVKAPIVIGRDHLDSGSVASPYRETEAMRDGSDAIADWPILNALINSVNGATWTSFHHGGGVGIGYSLHAGMVVVADGTEKAAKRLKRVLNSDPAMGVIRHADAGYEIAVETAKKKGIKIPGITV